MSTWQTSGDAPPAVSVVIPCYNAEQWLSQAIESVLEQTTPPAEIIVVDDGSTDASADVARRFGSRIIYVRQANHGSCAARNRGLRLTSGLLIQYMDADDLLHRRRLEILIEAWRAAPDAQFAVGGYRSFKTGEVGDEEISQGELTIREPQIVHDLLSVDYLPVTGLFRKSFLESLGPWNESLSRWVDLEFHARIAAHSRAPFPFVDLPLYGYRQHDGPRISSYNKAQTKLDEGLNSLEAARLQLESAGLIAEAGERYLFPCYIQLARGYASAGNRDKFVTLLRTASACTGREGFKYKAAAAEAFARMFGARMTAQLLNRFLPPP
ncbi:MAG: glycosyltransferase family 2 protein [Alphaproteobacteria bacterium]|nr:glycosyltransferase family 2 protein [Alphaproteobacteria bacterium]